MADTDSAEFLKIKLDFIKPLTTTVIAFDGGIASYLFVNFEKLSFFRTTFLILLLILLSAFLVFLFFYSFNIMKEM